jgi:hypothetical protein
LRDGNLKPPVFSKFQHFGSARQSAFLSPRFVQNLNLLIGKHLEAPPRDYTGSVKIALAQIDPTVGDFTGNLERIVAASRRAAALGAGLPCFQNWQSAAILLPIFLKNQAFWRVAARRWMSWRGYARAANRSAGGGSAAGGG